MHLNQCKKCLAGYIVASLDRGYLPRCINETCPTKLSHDTVLKLLEGHPDAKKYRDLFAVVAIRSNPNFGLCPVDETTLVEFKGNSRIQYCAGCGKKHCFVCGVDHSSKQSCLEACPEKYKDVIAVYRSLKRTNPQLEWKICPYCGVPAEKQDGCDEIVCGNNYHADDGIKDHAKIADHNGCGRTFKWGEARVFVPKVNSHTQSKEPTHGNIDSQGLTWLYHEEQLPFELNHMGSSLYTREQAIEAALHDRVIDPRNIVACLNCRFKAWLDRKSITNHADASRAYVALYATWLASFELTVDRAEDYFEHHDWLRRSHFYNWRRRSHFCNWPRDPRSYSFNGSSRWEGFWRRAFQGAKGGTIFADPSCRLTFNLSSSDARGAVFFVAKEVSRSVDWFEVYKIAKLAAERVQMGVSYRRISEDATGCSQALRTIEFRTIERIYRHIAQRSAIIFLYNNFDYLLDAAYDHTRPWTRSKSELKRILENIIYDRVGLSFDNEGKQLLGPFIWVLYRKVQSMPDRWFF